MIREHSLENERPQERNAANDKRVISWREIQSWLKRITCSFQLCLDKTELCWRKRTTLVQMSQTSRSKVALSLTARPDFDKFHLNPDTIAS